STRNPNSADFNISSTKVYDGVIAGNSVEFDFSTNGVNGFSGNLSLSATPLISGITYNFSNTSVSAGQPAKLTVSTSSSVNPGVYCIACTAPGGGIPRKTPFRLTVFEPQHFAGVPVNATNLAGFTNMTSGLQIGADGTIHLSFDDDTENVTG